MSEGNVIQSKYSLIGSNDSPVQFRTGQDMSCVLHRIWKIDFTGQQLVMGTIAVNTQSTARHLLFADFAAIKQPTNDISHTK
jgi:hypothetical protein